MALWHNMIYGRVRQYARLTVTIGVALCLSVVAAWVVSCYATPRGIYVQPSLCADGAYVEFRNGHVTLLTFDLSTPYGTYAMVAGKWEWIDESGCRVVIKPSLRSLEVYDSESGSCSEEMPRRLYPLAVRCLWERWRDRLRSAYVLWARS